MTEVGPRESRVVLRSEARRVEASPSTEPESLFLPVRESETLTRALLSPCFRNGSPSGGCAPQPRRMPY